MDAKRAKILCVNPWIHDFAAFNLWNAPLGLYHVAEVLDRKIKAEFTFIDLADAPVKPRSDGRSHIDRTPIEKPTILKDIPRRFCRYGISPSDAREKISALAKDRGGKFDAVLVTSLMGYWHTGVSETIALIKNILPKTPVILGGIYATLYADHARKHSGADVVLTGPAATPQAVGALIAKLTEFGVDIIRKPQTSIDQANTANSHWSNFVTPKIYAPIATGEGCPMKCSYCASHILSPKFIQRESSAVINEMLHLHAKGVRNFAFYDDALLINSEALIAPVLEAVAAKMPDTQLFTPVGVQSRFITPKLAQLMHRAKLGHMRLGFETANSLRQSKTGGKTTNEELKQAFTALTQAGYSEKDIGVFIMHGLPDQPIEEVEAAVAFAKKLGAKIALTEYSPIPHTAESGKVPQEVFDEPLLSNNTAYSLLFGRYDPQRLAALHLSAKE